MARGVTRKVDDFGRVVVPREIQRQLGWETGDAIEITVKGEVVSLQKYNPGCTFCGVAEGDQVELRGKLVCMDCRKLLGPPPSQR